MFAWLWKAAIAGIAVLAATALVSAETGGHQGHGDSSAQEVEAPDAARSGTGGCPMMKEMHGKHAMMGKHGGKTAVPTLAGQDAFAAIQEVVQMLEADPQTDWSKVDIAALREHLIDMNEVTLRAAAYERPLGNGVEIIVTGEGRTADAIKRMVPAHASALSATGWNAKTEDLPNGVKLVVTSDDTAQVTKLRALGFMGIMVQGSHHQPHHLMMAKGEHPHTGAENAPKSEHSHSH
jgi:hypothetical protein